ncbi:MAG: FkbM family methyltransferase [Sulfitobacter sp.]
MNKRFDMGDVTLEIPPSLLNPRLSQKITARAYEASEARAARMRLRPNHRVLELGGGVGYISSICAQITDPANVTTVEANPNTLPVIRHNLDLNGAKSATLLHGAVTGTAQPPLQFSVGKVFCGSAIAAKDAPQAGRITVPALCIWDLLSAHRPHVVIIDIEGAEADLFARPWPSHVRHVIMEIHPKKYPASAIKNIVDCMSQSGLTYDPGCSTGKLLGFRRVPQD